ncbi:murein biosynthesis integral membrane protein MurJ [Maribacter sp. HTCC2170]|uniref:murein biosynthesis integral membrane protein MurJ n=1 Tax=Maribacter sp. (strain HTCC2170 / KCCM 42371) TaxID=313603 RepID=UPI00006B49BA|nr:lipid II flippase MurJ [Maribacter sp. HTCC2170]EAR01097.1 putative virulence factor MviN family [Maribacter sp. HTCC2170]
MWGLIKNRLTELDLKNLFQKRVIQNILTVATITLFLKGIGFFKESIIAANFGLSEVLDTFFIASLVPAFISNVFIGAFKSVFIPNYIAELKTGNSIASFQAMGFFITGLVSLVFMIFAILFTDVYLELVFPGHSYEYYSQIKMQFYYLMPCIFLWGFSSLLGGLLNIDEEFKLTSYSSIFVPAAIILCIFLLDDLLGNMVLAIGTLIGSTLTFLFLLWISIQRKIIRLDFPDFSNTNARLMFAQVPAKVSSGFLTGMNSVVDQYFAAQLAVGSIAAINYGTKMPAFLVSLLLVALTNVLVPYFSKMAMENRRQTFSTVFKMFKFMFIGASICALVGILMTDFLVELFFQRKEFTSDDTILVSHIQKIFLIYAPFTVSGMILVNFLTSINKNAFMAYLSFGALILNIVLDYLLMMQYGILGIAFATTLVTITKGFILFFYTYNLNKKEKNQNLKDI